MTIKCLSATERSLASESSTNQGPLHIRAKSRDHEILRAQKWECLKAIPRHFQNHVVWSWILKCSVKSYVTGPSSKCYFNECLFMRVLTHDKNRINQRMWAFRVPWSLGLPSRGGFENSASGHKTWSIGCHAGVHVDFYIRLAFTYSFGPSSRVWSGELGPAPPFPQMRVLEVWWSWALSLVCEVALSSNEQGGTGC